MELPSNICRKDGYGRWHSLPLKRWYFRLPRQAAMPPVRPPVRWKGGDVRGPYRDVMSISWASPSSERMTSMSSLVATSSRPASVERSTTRTPGSRRAKDG